MAGRIEGRRTARFGGIMALTLTGLGAATIGGASEDRSATGALEGVVTFAGPVPDPGSLDMSRNAYCSGANDEPVPAPGPRVGAARGLADVLVIVRDGPIARGGEVSGEDVVLDQLGCIYRPRVLGVRAGQELIIRNSDATLHNVHAHAEENRGFNLGQPVRGMSSRRSFANPEIVGFTCDVHGWMEAWVAVVDHPHFAITGDDGAFQLPGLPAGDYLIELWHPDLGTLERNVTVGPDGTARLEVQFSAS